MRSRSFLLAAGLMCGAATLGAQVIQMPPRGTVAQLPVPNPGLRGRMRAVTDGATATDCTAGGGTYAVLCIDNGTDWGALAFADALIDPWNHTYAGDGSVTFNGPAGLNLIIGNGDFDIELDGTAKTIGLQSYGGNISMSASGSTGTNGYILFAPTAGLKLNEATVPACAAGQQNRFYTRPTDHAFCYCNGASLTCLGDALRARTVVADSLPLSCTTGDLAADTGASPRLCLCVATNTWKCSSLA